MAAEGKQSSDTTRLHASVGKAGPHFSQWRYADRVVQRAAAEWLQVLQCHASTNLTLCVSWYQTEGCIPPPVSDPPRLRSLRLAAQCARNPQACHRSQLPTTQAQ